jgi:glycerol-3-phosphate dehydrogenase
MESCLERARLLRTASHLVKSAKFLFPVYRDDRFGLFMMNLGFWLYDALALFTGPRLHKMFFRKKTLAREPGLLSRGLKGSFLYDDCRVNDARLVLNNVLSAAAHGGLPVNYAEAFGADRGENGGRIVYVRDRLTERVVEVPCQKVVYAVGPWTNDFFTVMENGKKDILRLTKGVHLVFHESRFKTRHAVVIMSNADKRIVFIVPWEEYTLVGTTDTDYAGDLDNVLADQNDVKSLLDIVNARFPAARLAPGDAISAFAGLRPLVREKGSASAVSRRDKIFRSGSGALVIGGGKLTTYRRMAENAVDKIVRDLQKAGRGPFRPCRTGSAPLLEVPAELLATIPRAGSLYPFDARAAEYLILRYGRNFSRVLDLARSDPALAGRICRDLPFIFAEIPFAAEHEMLVHITDFFRLRTEIFLKAPDNGLGALRQSAEILGHALGWDQKARDKQISDYKVFVNANLQCIGREVA